MFKLLDFVEDTFFLSRNGIYKNISRPVERFPTVEHRSDSQCQTVKFSKHTAIELKINSKV
jgi:hypothetical protein